jgi:small-conductance mechanosensitive channel
MRPGTVLAATTTPPAEQTDTQAVASELLPEWLKVPGWEVVLAVLVFAAGVYLSKFLVRLLGRPIARRFRRQSVAQTVLRLVRLTTVVAASLVALSLVGFRFGDLVLSVTVFSAVLGIVLAPIAGSIINGLFVLADQPYEIGDMIELEDGTRGFVDEITIRYTKIFTLDNTFLVIPNSTIRERDVTNFSAEDERTRLSLDLLVTYEGDLDAARDLAERAAAEVDDVVEGGPDIRVGNARYPARPRCLIASYADNGVLLRLRYWANKPYRIPAIQSEVQGEIWDRLAESEGVEFAYPHQHLIFDETSGTASVSVGRDAAAVAHGAGGASAEPEPVADDGGSESASGDAGSVDPQDRD